MKPIYAEILTIGDELLYGQITDTNSQWMGVALGECGIRVIRKTTVGDNETDILTALAEAEQRADIILISGGLGPTNDDLTKPCLARYFNVPLVLNEEALAQLSDYFIRRGRTLSDLNKGQAWLPQNCLKITNTLGTAPGMWFYERGKVFVSMPGVPYEMKKMMTDTVLPKLKETFATPHLQHLVIRTVGIPESVLAERIKSWEDTLPPHIRLAYLPSLGEVKLRLTGTGPDPEKIAAELAHWRDQLLSLAGKYIYGYGDQPLEAVLGHTLRTKKLTLAIAESCTGGFLSHLITSIPGSSDYFIGSMIPYSYEVKMRQLGVKPETLATYGAVSEPTITEMANIVRAKFNTDIGVATSGIAGPGGATPEKPVGLVWIAYSDRFKTVTHELRLTHDRMLNIRLASMAVLNLIRQNLPVGE